ncbi:MAG: SDR family NAD(P)-dependent oxidoreductase, partial [Frankia sp.]|nr:SDR family NAD(P)-dependent oxidoreductase [Frankia sp.]
SAASTSAATAAADAGPHAGVAGRVSSTGAFVADLSELARDHLALHTQFLDSQLRVAEGLVGVLRATPATAGSADKIRAAADAVVRQSLAVGDAHIRVNEILASLASLELDGGGAQRAASAGTAGPIAAATGTPPVAYSTEAPWPSRSLASAPPAPSSALVDIPTQPVPVSGNGSGKADFGGPTQWLPLGVDLSPGTAPVSAAPTSTLSTGAAPASGTGANGAGSAGAAADSTAGPSGVAADPPAGTAPDPSVVVSAVAEVVAEKTGYPAEVLEPSMALESDLGVDSIKRVQILGALQDRFPGVPTVGPERLAELRTLEDIARFLRDGLGADASPSAAGTVVDAGVVAGDAPAPPGAPAAAGAAGTAEIQRLRLAIRRVPAVDPLDTPFGADPRAVVVDVGGRGAAALARRLEATGMRVQVVTLAAGLASPGVGTATLASWDGGDAEAALAALGDLPRLDLCLLVVGDADTDGGTDSGTGEEGAGNALDGALTGAAAGAVSPGAVSRRLADAVMVASRLRAALGAAAAAGRRAAFVAVTRIDGLLGHGGEVPPPAAMAGGVAGLVKTFAREAPEVFCRMLDVHPALGEDAWVDTVLREITDSARDVVEIGVDGESRRWSVEYTDDPADDDPADGPTDSAAARPPVDASDVLVVTGGARGVTARCVEELARECPGELVLLGRTEPADDPGWAVGVPDEGLRAAAVAAASAEGRAVNLPEAHAAARAVAAAREARATLAALTAAGARVRHLAVDVTDPAATARALAPYRDRVTGVVHGAGALADALLADKTPAAVRTVLAAKLDGLWSVLGALDGAPLRHLVLFTSVAGVFGNPGQADYATANEALVRVAASLRGRLAGRVVALNWGAWDGGMVTPDLRELFRSRGVALLPPDEGARRFAAELLAGDGGDRAVLIGGSSPLADGSDRPAPAPFVAHRSLAGLQADPVIDDHQIGPAPVLPATAGLGWLVNVVERANPGYQVVRARGFEVHKGIVLDGSHVRDYWLDARPADGDGGARPGDGTVTVTAAVRSDSGAALPASHYAATLVLAPAPAPGSSTPATPTSALTAPRAAGWPGYRLGEQGEDAGFVYAEGILSHGPLLAGIRRLLVRERTRLVAECRLPDSPIAAGAFAGRLHSPALCDVLVATASLLGRWYLGDAGCLPLGIADAEFFAPIPDDEPFVAVIDDLREGSTGVTVTATACTPDGRVLQRLTGVALVPTPDMADLIREAARRRDSRARTNDGPGTHGPRTDVSGAEGRAEKETGR